MKSQQIDQIVRNRLNNGIEMSNNTNSSNSVVCFTQQMSLRFENTNVADREKNIKRHFH